MIRSRRYVNRAKHAPKLSDAFNPLDVAMLLQKEINSNNLPFEVASAQTGIPEKRIERIYRNDLPTDDEMVRILEWVGKEVRDEGT